MYPLAATIGLPIAEAVRVIHERWEVDRLTVEADKLGGQVCIRGYRFSVEHLLELLAGGWDLARIQRDFPFIDAEDIQQSLGYAAALAHREVYVPLREPA